MIAEEAKPDVVEKPPLLTLSTPAVIAPPLPRVTASPLLATLPSPPMETMPPEAPPLPPPPPVLCARMPAEFAPAVVMLAPPPVQCPALRVQLSTVTAAPLLPFEPPPP